jgi:hypothetical protein
MRLFFLLSTLSLFFLSCDSIEEKRREKFESEKKQQLIEKYKCDNVDDCLSKYQFEGARAYMAAEEEINGLGVYRNLPKITQAEAIYLAKQNEFQRALDVINEANQVNYLESDKEHLKYLILEMAVIKFCEDGDFEKAKLFTILKASDTQQKILIKKIKDAQIHFKK